MSHVPVQSVRELSVGWKEAYEAAVKVGEPVFVPQRHYCDDRGYSLMNLLGGVLSSEGQINFSVQYPGVVKAWHRHQHQTDFWVCVSGHLKAGICAADRSRAWVVVMGEKKPGVLVIPPTLWHGAATVGPNPAGLLYYVTRAFNPASPDEERLAWDGVAGFPWETQHR